MNRRRSRLAGLLALALILLGAAGSTAARAEAVILLHGYGSGPETWQRTGIIEVFEREGWAYAGRLEARRPVPPLRGPRVYTVDYDGLAPLETQRRQLGAALAGLTDETGSIVLVGHSAGGVLARYYLVRAPDPRVSAVISIASPHLGSQGAGLAQLAQSTPLGWFWDRIPGRSKPLRLAAELAPEQPGNFLFWLNRQVHPPIQYLAVIHRSDSAPSTADWLVDPRSQDLGRVAALRGRARSLTRSAGHDLDAGDGPVLVRLLRSLGRT